MADRAGTLERSTTEIIQDLGRDIGGMVRSEIRLAKAEMKESAIQAGKGIGLLGGAALCGFFVVACIVTACIWLLALAMPIGAAAGIMAIILACIGGALYAGGRSRLRQVKPVPERTIQTLKEPLR